VEAIFEDGDSQIEYTDRLLDMNIIRFESESPLKDARLDPQSALAMVIPPPSVDGAQLSSEIRELPWTGAGSKALKVFKKATKASLLNARDWFKLGMTLYDGKNYTESLKAFEFAAQRAEKGSSRYYTSNVWQGHILDLLGQRDKALECYREALKCKQKGNWVRHDQYRMAINRKWVEKRIEKPFVCDESKR
jgi:tetratricopeptide (TPR) repeat protein